MNERMLPNLLYRLGLGLTPSAFMVKMAVLNTLNAPHPSNFHQFRIPQAAIQHQVDMIITVPVFAVTSNHNFLIEQECMSRGAPNFQARHVLQGLG